jgi:hypothetical protein
MLAGRWLAGGVGALQVQLPGMHMHTWAQKLTNSEADVAAWFLFNSLSLWRC